MKKTDLIAALMGLKIAKAFNLSIDDIINGVKESIKIAETDPDFESLRDPEMPFDNFAAGLDEVEAMVADPQGMTSEEMKRKAFDIGVKNGGANPADISNEEFIAATGIVDSVGLNK